MLPSLEGPLRPHARAEGSAALARGLGPARVVRRDRLHARARADRHQRPRDAGPCRHRPHLGRARRGRPDHPRGRALRLELRAARRCLRRRAAGRRRGVDRRGLRVHTRRALGGRRPRRAAEASRPRAGDLRPLALRDARGRDLHALGLRRAASRGGRPRGRAQALRERLRRDAGRRPAHRPLCRHRSGPPVARGAARLRPRVPFLPGAACRSRCCAAAPAGAVSARRA